MNKILFYLFIVQIPRYQLFSRSFLNITYHHLQYFLIPELPRLDTYWRSDLISCI